MRKLLSVAAVASIVSVAEVGHGAQPAAFSDDIAKQTDQNTDFRRVLFTARHVQVVAMAVPKGESIGEEVHKVDQCLFFTKGKGRAVIDGAPTSIGKNGVVCIPAGTRHDIQNTGSDALKLFTVYGPPEHPPGTVHHTKADAQKAEEAETKSH